MRAVRTSVERCQMSQVETHSSPAEQFADGLAMWMGCVRARNVEAYEEANAWAGSSIAQYYDPDKY